MIQYTNFIFFQEYHKKMNERIGIDFGKTIADIFTNLEDPIKQQMSNAFSIITNIINRYQPKNVFIISKAKQENSQRIMKWLENTDFLSKTGFLRENVLFVRDYIDKRALVDQHKINYFIDDNYKVIRELYSAKSLNKIIWFCGNQCLLKEIPKEYRQKIQISNNWNSIYKTFSKPCMQTINFQKIKNF